MNVLIYDDGAVVGNDHISEWLFCGFIDDTPRRRLLFLPCLFDRCVPDTCFLSMNMNLPNRSFHVSCVYRLSLFPSTLSCSCFSILSISSEIVFPSESREARTTSSHTIRAIFSLLPPPVVVVAGNDSTPTNCALVTSNASNSLIFRRLRTLRMMSQVKRGIRMSVRRQGVAM